MLSIRRLAVYQYKLSKNEYKAVHLNLNMSGVFNRKLLLGSEVL